MVTSALGRARRKAGDGVAHQRADVEPGSRRTGSRPPRLRASTSRSSARRVSRSVSSAALRSAPISSSGVRARRSASSSSAFRLASGVRSSWLASPTNRARARPPRRGGPASGSGSRPGARARSPLAGTARRRPGSDARDRLRLDPKSLDRPQRGAGHQPADGAGQRDRHGPADQQLREQQSRAPPLILERGADHQRAAPGDSAPPAGGPAPSPRR